MAKTRGRTRYLLSTGSALALALCACGGDSNAAADAGEEQPDRFGNAGSTAGNAGSDGAGSGGRAAGSGAGGNGGAAGPADGGGGGASDAGAADAGATPADAGVLDAGGTPGGPMGTLPLGALCANDGNCSQAMGEANCCNNSCELVADCPQSPGYLPCTDGADCAQFGGGKICCELGAERFCTKRSACGGEEIP